MVESTKDETWQVWLRKWIASLSPIATLLAAFVAFLFVAQPQLDVSQDIARRQLRPYVHVTSARISDSGEESKVGVFIIENLGLTPAYGIDVDSNASVELWPEEPRRDRGGGFSVSLDETVLGPRASMSFDTVRKLEMGHVQSIKEGKAYIRFWGTIRYTDTFKKSHATHFEYAYGGPHSIKDEVLRRWGNNDAD